MGKNKKRRRQKHSLLVATAAGGVTPLATLGNNATMDGDDDDDDDGSLANISELALQTTLHTLVHLSKDPERLQEKRFKELRRALHPLVLHQLKSYDNGTDYRVKATQALQLGKWAVALAALQGCRHYEQIPKQGTIQRWVRDCDQAPATCKLQLFNAVLLVQKQQQQQQQQSASTNDDPAIDEQSVNMHDPTLAIAQHLGDSPVSEELTLLEDWGLGRRLSAEKIEKGNDTTFTVALHSRILYQEEASTRKPPNHYDLHLHTTEPGSIQWDTNHSTTSDSAIHSHPVPFLPTGQAYLLDNVLTLEECRQLRTAASTLGFRPDHPTSLDKPTGIDSCEWLVDDSILSVLNDRVRAHLPKNISTTTSSSFVSHGKQHDEDDEDHNHQSLAFHSINPRWRFFRYGQGCVYRPHIDGSWPASRINDQGDYESDESGMIKSYWTFLMYLNDDFEGGSTRFYFPSSLSSSPTGNTTTHGGGGGLAAQGIIPRCGSVLVFAQGNTASLIHEGSGVTKGTKFVVRSDVLCTHTTPAKR